MSENILVINVHSSRNLGDAALLHVTLQQLRESFPACKLTVSMDDPQSHQGSEQVVESIVSWTHPKQADGTVRWNYLRMLALLPCSLVPILTRRITGKQFLLLTPGSLRPAIEAYLQADLVISGPGGFLYSSGRGISLLITVFSIAVALLARKPLYILPQSIGPLKHDWEKALVRWILDRARIVMVREPISMRLVQQIGVNIDHVELIPDLAFAIPRSDTSIGRDWLLNSAIQLEPKSPLLGMTIINWGEQHAGFDGQHEYEEACAGAIKWFIESTGGKVILFPQVFGPYISQDDRIPAKRVVGRLSECTSSIIVIESPLPLDLLKSIYGWMDVFVGTRMHSTIFALSEGVPVIMIGYLPKTRGMAEMLGIDRWCLEIRDVKGNSLVDLLQQLWEQRSRWMDENNNKVSEKILDTSKVAEKVRVDYDGWARHPDDR